MTASNQLPLSRFSEDEELFRESVASFAQTSIQPFVAEMDQEGKFRPDLVCM